MLTMLDEPGENEVQVSTPECIYCGNRAILHVDKFAMFAFLAGTPVHIAFPSLDADQRELILSGTHAHCWAALFGDKDTDDDGNEKGKP